jgi:hypothetical protein
MLAHAAGHAIPSPIPVVVIELGAVPAVICGWSDSDDEYVTRWFDARPELFRRVAELIAAAESEASRERAA